MLGPYAAPGSRYTLALALGILDSYRPYNSARSPGVSGAFSFEAAELCSQFPKGPTKWGELAFVGVRPRPALRMRWDVETLGPRGSRGCGGASWDVLGRSPGLGRRDM